MRYRPSDIFYSQDSIANHWGKNKNKFIGETLDKLLNKSISLTDIPNISAVMIKGKFVTCDNRRLWVFRKAEKLGFLDYIEFDQVTIQQFKWSKFTTKNGGKSILIRGGGDPGGTTWRTWTPYTGQEVNKNTVRESALNAHERKTDIFQDSLCNKNVTDIKCRSNYLSSYSNNYFSRPNDIFRNGETKLSDKENHLPITIKSKQEGILCTNINLESTFSKTAVPAQKPKDYTIKVDDISDTNCSKTGTLAARPRTFSNNNVDSNVPDKHTKFSRMGPIFEEKAMPDRASYFESNLPGPRAYKNRTDINQDDLCSRTVSNFNLPNILKSPPEQNNPTRPTYDTYKVFKNNLDSHVINTGIQFSAIQSTSQEKSAIHRKSHFESPLRKTLLPVHKPHPDIGRTYVIKDSSCNKTFIENEQQNKEKSAYRKIEFARTDFICGNTLTGILNSEVPDNQIERPTINTKSQGEAKTKAKYEEETAICHTPVAESTLNKTSLLIQQPHNNASGTEFVTEYPCNKTFTEAYLSKTKSPYRKNLSERPCAIIDYRGDAKPRSPHSFGLNLDQTSLDVQKPHPNTSGTRNCEISTGNQTITKAKRQSKDISAYFKPFSAKPNDL